MLFDECRICNILNWGIIVFKCRQFKYLGNIDLDA